MWRRVLAGSGTLGVSTDGTHGTHGTYATMAVHANPNANLADTGEILRHARIEDDDENEDDYLRNRQPQTPNPVTAFGGEN